MILYLKKTRENDEIRQRALQIRLQQQRSYRLNEIQNVLQQQIQHYVVQVEPQREVMLKQSLPQHLLFFTAIGIHTIKLDEFELELTSSSNRITSTYIIKHT